MNMQEIRQYIREHYPYLLAVEHHSDLAEPPVPEGCPSPCRQRCSGTEQYEVDDPTG